VRLWFERLFRLFPFRGSTYDRSSSRDHRGDVYVTVDWLAHVTPAAGGASENAGAHVLRFRALPASMWVADGDGRAASVAQ
jgi:hypothetical protein